MDYFYYLNRVNEGLATIVALTSVLIGCVYLFAGFKLKRFTISLTIGLISGIIAVIWYISAERYSWEMGVIIFLFLLFLAIGMLLGYGLHKFFTFVTLFGIAFIIQLILIASSSGINYDKAITFALISSFAFAILGIMFLRPIYIIATSFGGATLVFNVINLEERQEFFGFIILALIGIFVQWITTRGENKSYLASALKKSATNQNLPVTQNLPIAQNIPKDSFCSNCGNKITFNGKFCSECGEESKNYTETSSLNEDFSTLVVQNVSYYNKAFAILKARKCCWNWGAFFGYFWYPYRKMHIQSIIYIVLTLLFLRSPLLSLIFAIANGLIGNFIYKQHLARIQQNIKNIPENAKNQVLAKSTGVSIDFGVAYTIGCLILAIIFVN